MPGPSGDLEEWQTLGVNVTLSFASGDIDLLGLPFLKVTLEPRHYLYNITQLYYWVVCFFKGSGDQVNNTCGKVRNGSVCWSRNKTCWPCNVPVPCKEGKHYGDPICCKSLFHCGAGGNQMTHKICGEGACFNTKISSCDHDSKCLCEPPCRSTESPNWNTTGQKYGKDNVKFHKLFLLHEIICDFT